MSDHQTVTAPEIPLYQGGSLDRGDRRPMLRRRPHKYTATVRAPETPLYQLGYFGAAAQAVAASSPIAAVATTALLSNTAWGAAAGPIGAGVGALVGLIAGLMAAHELRAKQAKNENAATNLGVQGFDQGLRQIQQAYTSGQIDASGVQQAVGVLLQNYWAEVSAQIQPGRNGCSNGSTCPTEIPGKQPCQGNIGAACCVGCYPLTQSINGPSGVLAALAGQSTSPNGPYKADTVAVGASSYGTSYRAPYTLDFTPPAPATPGAALTSALSSLTGGAGSSSSMFPLLLIGGLLFLVSR